VGSLGVNIDVQERSRNNYLYKDEFIKANAKAQAADWRGFLLLFPAIGRVLVILKKQTLLKIFTLSSVVKTRM